MKSERRLYRSRHALIGGVCAGAAECFDLDPVIVRILAVALTLLTAGLFAVAYVVLWLALPVAPHEPGPVEVEPQSVRSDTYGSVDYDAARSRADDAARAASEVAAACQHLPYDAYAGTGHVPPEPPTAEAAAWARRAQRQTPPGWQAPGWRVPGEDRESASQGTPSASAFSQQSEPTVDGQRGLGFESGPRSAPQQVEGASGPAGSPSADPQFPLSQFTPNLAASPRPERRDGVKAAVLIGAFLLFFGVAAVLSENIDGVSWWQFWPLLLIIIGILQMAVPAERGRRTERFAGGLVFFSLGATLLSMSLGVVGWATVPRMLASLWPLLLVAIGLFIAGRALRSPRWTLVAGLCLALFCVAGLMWFSVPGPFDFLVVDLPFGYELSFPFEVSAIPAR
ncbi:hypothetical protein C1878_01070 [Gordonibacter sp. 28C]|uniref:PspC domain-containing protein n=1 Tax=Gordonibacter sp. 28C TaxID=2078569 RepID=UPI000DF75358|nr:PspC domain-containing protein [Gordonibacter sp. 28C]RDB64471.1 hypothetical protein C1878_01070 [Gordonibacter sp. 28C]